MPIILNPKDDILTDEVRQRVKEFEHLHNVSLTVKSMVIRRGDNKILEIWAVSDKYLNNSYVVMMDIDTTAREYTISDTTLKEYINMYGYLTQFKPKKE